MLTWYRRQPGFLTSTGAAAPKFPIWCLQHQGQGGSSPSPPVRGGWGGARQGEESREIWMWWSYTCCWRWWSYTCFTITPINPFSWGEPQQALAFVSAHSFAARPGLCAHRDTVPKPRKHQKQGPSTNTEPFPNLVPPQCLRKEKHIK